MFISSSSLFSLPGQLSLFTHRLRPDEGMFNPCVQLQISISWDSGLHFWMHSECQY